MKFKQILTVISIIGCTGLCACSDSLLDIEQMGVKSEQNSYITDQDAEQAIAAVYRRFRQAYCGKGESGDDYAQGFWLKNLLSDEILPGGNSPQDQQGIQELGCSEVQANNSFILEYYKRLYHTIYLANIVIEHFENSTSDIKLRDVAEAKFFRAMCHFELVTLWGNPPLVTKVLTTPEQQRAANTPAEETWAQIEKDLNDAINSGKMASKADVNDTETTTRATREAAQALLGKALLYQKKYALAKEQFLNVIKSKKYELVDDISVFYHVEGSGSNEYVFECNRHKDDVNRPHQGGALTILCNWPFGECIQGSDSWKFYQFNNSGYGFFHPTKKLYDAFVTEEGVDGYRLNQSIKTFQQQVKMDIYYNHVETFNLKGTEGLLRFKWLPTTRDEVFESWAGSEATTPVMRYADVLLMMSEACLLSGDQQNADKYLNEVRSRAKLTPKSDVTLTDIKTERNLELAMEGVRYQDLIRWGDAPVELADKGKKYPVYWVWADPTNDYNTVDGRKNAQYVTNLVYENRASDLAGWTPGRDELLPYPQDEVNVNPNIKQNPGYN